MVKKSRIILLIFVFCLFVFNMPTEAREGSGFYIGLKPGVYFPQGDIVDVPGYDTDPGFGLEIPIGYRFNENVGTELSLGWYCPNDQFMIPRN